MTHVSAVTPGADAASPSHPDHARWVKEKTLAMEIAHARATGGTLRDAETENSRLLIRMEAIAREQRDAPATRKAKIERPRKTREQRMLERAVTVRAAQPQVSPLKLSPCGRCGTCRRCMRERRILAIIQKGRAGDRTMLQLAWEVTATTLDAKGGVGRYVHMTPQDANRAVIAKAESVCERSVRWLGPWL